MAPKNLEDNIKDFSQELYFEKYEDVVIKLNTFLEEQKEVINYIHWFIPEENTLKMQLDYYNEHGNIEQGLFVISKTGANFNSPVATQD